MSRLIPTSERITRARALILKARELPVAKDFGGFDFSYVANVKDLLQQARDLIKFISYSPSATPDVKREVAEIFKEIELTEKEILHKPLVS
jgi:ABC-type Na+ transport system ATPase subunit NatA